MASPRALGDWCRLTCASYPDVDIKNMSTSFTDGLAFCAIIHKHRPDLIDFSSLSKDNGYQNNKLAFEVAETKLGIPALLDPKEMVSTKMPDCLSVMTYLSQYYCFFNRKSHGPAGLRSSHNPVLNSHTKSKAPEGLKALKSWCNLETTILNLSNTKPRAACKLCFKPVHLIQRHLFDGKICHRSCYRCRVCQSTLLPESYAQDGSLICSHHVTDGKSTRADLHQQTGSFDNHPNCKLQAEYFSLDGLNITSVPHYTKKTEFQDRQVCQTPEMEGEKGLETSREMKGRENSYSTVELKKSAPLYPSLCSIKNRTVYDTEEARPAPSVADGKKEASQQPPLLPSPCIQSTEGRALPIAAPRKTLDASEAPVPAPRIKASQTASGSPAAGNSSNQSKYPFTSSQITSPTCVSHKVKTNHPWMAIVHPGPWTQLPPAPAPVPAPRSKSVSSLREPWCRTAKVPPPNPFAEDEEKDTWEEAVKPESSDHTKSTVEASRSENSDNYTDVSICSGDAGKTRVNDVKDVKGRLSQAKRPGLKEAAGAAGPAPVEGERAVTNAAQTSSEIAGSQTASLALDENGSTGGFLPDVTEAPAESHAASDEPQSHFLPKSLSVPVFTSVSCQSPSVPVGLTEAQESVTSCRSKLECKQHPFDRKAAIPKSNTFQELPSKRTPAPGHGFPLIKRKVQADQHVSPDDLQTEMGEVHKHLEALEQQGVELERNLRDCKNAKDEEQMLVEWFSLIHERRVLMHRDSELVYLTKQKKLEEKQADVEYELRCLLNKPESDWSLEDRGREQKLMDELVTIIEQRNQIISSLDQDRQREKEEDELWTASSKTKEFQKERLKELKKSKGKFKPTNFFKMLSHKGASSKDAMDKKS